MDLKKVVFWKMSGSGNDFIIINNLENDINDKLIGVDIDNIISKVCSRRVSIGADGLVLIEKSDKHDFKWTFYNADGSKPEMCGNASRCTARFAYLNGISGINGTFETLAGNITYKIMGDKLVKVQMTNPFDMKLDCALPLDDLKMNISSVNTGVPHAVQEVSSVEDYDVEYFGKLVRDHAMFQPEGTNVNFFSKRDQNTLRMRTFERGVEGETLACGTGAVATAIIATTKNIVYYPVYILTSSKEILKVDKENNKYFLEGDVRIIYKGVFYKESYLY